MPEPDMVSWVAKAVDRRERKDMAMIESMADGRSG